MAGDVLEDGLVEDSGPLCDLHGCDSIHFKTEARRNKRRERSVVGINAHRRRE